MLNSTYKGTLVETTWQAERERIAAVNPKLHDILARFAPTQQHTFVKLISPFGVDIYQEGQLRLPNPAGVFVSDQDASLDAVLREKIAYGSSPLALLLAKTVEIYIKRPDGRVIPFKVFYPGQTFGEWAIMPQPKIVPRQNWQWNIATGAKTVFFPFKTTDSVSYARLKERYHLTTAMPDVLFKQGDVFREIVQHSDCDWRSEILFFTKAWLEPQPDNAAWHELKCFWAEQAWNQLHYWANRMVIDFDLEEYVESLTKCKIKVKPYLLDTLKQVLSIACGAIPGFRAVDQSEIDLPSRLIKDAFVNAYQLKYYLPMMMRAGALRLNAPTDTVYYSLQLPTMPESVRDPGFPSTLKLLSELKLYIDFFLDSYAHWPVGDVRRDLNSRIQFDYYHSDPDKFKSIQLSERLFHEDPLLQLDQQRYPDRIFPDSASFFRGCVKIHSKNQ